MKPTTLYRIASVLLLIFAAGHTYGFLKFKPSSPEGVAVWNAMSNVHFQVGGASYNYANFYTGFGLFATLYLLFASYLAWYLCGLAAKNPQAIGSLGWVFFLLQLASIGVSGMYFLPPPVILSALVAACAGWAGWQVGRIKA